MSLQGDLAEFPVGELLQTLTLNNHEGTLRVRTEKEGDRYFYVSKGEIQLVSPGKKGLRLGEALIKAKKLTQEQLDNALQQHTETGRMLGKTLIELQLIAESDIELVIQQQFREEFFELFLITKGVFEFFFRTRPDQLVQFDQTVSRVSMNTSGLMLEALRQIDEWQVMSKAITTPRAILRLVADDLEPFVDEMETAEDVRQATKLINGRRTVAEICEGTPATKFDVYALLVGLIDREAIRPLTREECYDTAVVCEESGETYEATVYFEFGAYLDPGDMTLRERQFKLLKRLAVYREAKEVALVIGERKLEEKDHDAALSYFLEAQACDEKDVRAKEGIFRASIMAGDKEKPRAIKAGDECVRAAIRAHDIPKAREILETLLELEPSGHRRKVQLADLCDDDPDGKALATRLLNEAIESLSRPEDAAAKADACRKLLAIDARNNDAQGKLKDAVSLEESLHRRKVRNIIVLNVVGVVLAIGTYLASYEIGARNAYQTAEAGRMAALESAGKGHSGPLEEVVEQLKFVSRMYPRSTVASAANATIAQLRQQLQELQKEEQARREAEVVRRREGDKVARRQAAVDLLRKASASEKQGAYRESAETKLEVVRSYADVELDQRIRLPVPIASEPAGALVTRGAEKLGKTPCVVYVEPGKESKVQVELLGWETVELNLKGDKFEEATLALVRTAVWTWKTGAAIETTPVLDRGRVICSSRDGEVYAVDAEKGTLVWRARLGEYGDRLSAPAIIGGKCLVGTSDGVVTALDPATGSPVWTLRAEGAIRAAPRASEDGVMVAVGAGDGVAHFLRAAGGERLFAASTEQRIEAPIAISGARAFVASRDGRLYAIALDGAQPGRAVWSFNAGTGFTSAPLVVGGAVVTGARDGTVTSLSAADGKTLWRIATPGRIRGDTLLSGAHVVVPSEDGNLYALDAKTGGLAWKLTADGALVGEPITAERGIYVASTAGTLYRIDPATGRATWTFGVGTPVRGGCAVTGGRIFIGGADGILRAVLE